MANTVKHEQQATVLGYVKYAAGQPVTPPDTEQAWWYRKDAPDGDWFNTAKEAVEAAKEGE